jgi:hypothetical protein
MANSRNLNFSSISLTISKSHKLYLPTADYEAPATDGSKGRPKMIPGSFQVLVYSIDK